MRKNHRQNSFTLIELLTVIAIIAILAGLLFPAIRAALIKAEVAQARTDIKAIETGLKAYFTEYGRWPHGNGDPDWSYGGGGGYCNNGGLMNVLRAISDGDSTCGNLNHTNNLRRIVFFEPPARKGAVGGGGNFLDPWGQQYEISIDTNYDNNTSNIRGAGVTVSSYVTNRAVAVWSRGPDGQSATSPGATTKDDIKSWE